MNSDEPRNGGAEALRQLAVQYGLEFLPAVSPEILDPALVARLSVEWARTHGLLPVRIDGAPCVLAADPRQVSEQEYLSMLLGVELRPVLMPRDEILRGIEQCYFRKEDSPQDFLRDMSRGRETEKPAARTDDLLQVAEKAPVTQLVNLILLEAVKRRASDIHFEPFENALRVRYRVDGVLYEQAAPSKQLEQALVSRLKIMAKMDIAEKRLPQDGMARVRVGEREIDIRVSTIPVAEGERVVLRLLDRDSALLPLSALGMPDRILQSFGDLLRHSSGMIIVSGPTGSGKTTTLYAALGCLDAARRNILTIEDPVEYQLSSIGQMQVKPKIGLTFASGLRHILRQDPDVVLVGETRDAETAEIAIRAALTGHLVFTTLHTNDAAGSVLRLVDMGVEPYLLASCLRGVLAQRLVRRLCPHCRRACVIATEEVRAHGPVFQGLIGKPAWQAGGCAQCLEGFKGRIGLFELLVADRAVQDFVRAGGAGGDGLRDAVERAGLSSLAGDAIAKMLDGTTSVSEALGVV